jgi:nucleotide-binding universal stress UspA family protein/RimJ/RimL family protein N-acetyltransferase
LPTRARTATLRDGAKVVIRPIGPEDAPLVVEAFERLSPASRYRRFLTPVANLSPEMLEYLTDVDHEQHEALIALDKETGQMIGAARYIRDHDLPERAEVAVTVTDDWQGRGVGRTLLVRLTARARSAGVTTFTALVLGDNRGAQDLLGSIGARSEFEPSGGPEVRLLIELPPRRGLGTQLTETLRAVAQQRIDPAEWNWSRRPARETLGWPVDPARPLKVVVVGTDGSETAAHAVAAAVQVAARFGAALHIATAHADGEEAAAATVLEAAAATARSAGLEPQVHARADDPARTITAIATEVAGDLIVVGNLGPTGMRRLGGSIDTAVSRHAPCSVLIVRTTP